MAKNKNKNANDGRRVEGDPVKGIAWGVLLAGLVWGVVALSIAMAFD